MKKDKVLFTLIIGLIIGILAFMVSMFVIGYGFGRAFPPPQGERETKTEYVWLPPLTVNVTQYIISPPQIIVKTVEVIKENAYS